MPTPHGSRGGMAFSADELRVLRRALAQVLHPPNQALALAPQPTAARSDLLPARPAGRGAWAEDVQEALRLAESIDETVDEAGRMRAFALADLARYRQALPGSAGGYLERLRDAVADGYVPEADDLSALRALTALPCAPAERTRRLELRSRCGQLAETSVRRLPAPPVPKPALPPPAAVRPALPPLPGPAARPALPPRQDRGFDRVPDGRVADVRVAGLRAGNVAEFARPARPQRLREQSRPFPIRPGGPTMDSYDSAPRPDDQDAADRDPEAPETAGQGRDRAAADRAPAERPAPPRAAAGKGGAAARPIPTPGDLFPRGVRRGHGDDQELATGTG
ncbi:hypothetical protein [Streptacidiphilus cavernicola]|uniref:Uncharacterized protein n=1 Tax=Streptacidiphilus cavernicola TaxID=3342716 RepID=A0ABV6VXM0_9ACTN